MPAKDRTHIGLKREQVRAIDALIAKLKKEQGVDYSRPQAVALAVRERMLRKDKA